MRIIGLNGSPRKQWNTATLLEKALSGAASQGAETELIHLFDLNYKGCASCFACKLKGGKHGSCALNDDLSPLIERIKESDGLILGSPVYLGDVTACVRAFLERMFFTQGIYSKEIVTLFPKKIPTGLIFTCNQPENLFEKAYMPFANTIIDYFSGRIGECRWMVSANTYQFDDYSKYESSIFSEPDKAKHKEAQFPADLKKAYDLGIYCAKPL